MQKWLVMLLVLSVAGFAQAQAGGGGGHGPDGAPGMGPGKKDGEPPHMGRMPKPPKPITKAKFVELEKRKAEIRGEEFDQAATEALFDKLDTNKDGLLSGEEMFKGPHPGPRGPITKEQFVEHHKMMAEQNGEEFDQAKVEARFDELDKNKDGVLTPDEMGPPPHRGPRQGGRDTEDDSDDQGPGDDGGPEQDG